MRMEPTDLERSVLQTVLWFSVFSYPVTSFEVWKWLFQPGRNYSLAQVYAVLDASVWLSEKLERQGAFIAPKGMCLEVLVEDRFDRHVHAERKYQALTRMATYFQILPGVRAVAAVNTMSLWATNRTSDIDLYIVTRPGTIWSTRFWLVLPFLLLGHRPTHHEEDEEEHHEDPFCFSFFSDQDHMQLESLSIERDYYMALWTRSLVPVLDRDKTFVAFEQMNRWARVIFPNASMREVHPYHATRSLVGFFPQWAVLERFYAGLQKKRMPSLLKDMANQDTRVVVHDGMLKFHVNDRRAQFRDVYEERVKTHV